MRETSVCLGESIQHTNHPENNVFEDPIRSVLRHTGQIRFSTLEDSPLHLQQTMRRLEKETINLASKLSHCEIPQARKLLQETVIRPNLVNQFLNQTEITVRNPKWGELHSWYTVVNPVEKLDFPVDNEAPPIVMLGGISADLQMMQGMSEEAALRGRRCIVLSYPESTRGYIFPPEPEKVNEDYGDPYGFKALKRIQTSFAHEVKVRDPFVPHAEYFTEVILTLQKQGILSESFDLYGYSTGGPIIMRMADEKNGLSSHIENIALIAPAGVVEQNPERMKTRAGLEMVRGILAHPGALSRAIFINERKKEHQDEKSRTFEALITQDARQYEFFARAQVKDGGKIVVISEENDNVTYTRNAHKLFKKIPNVIVEPATGNHMTPIMKPETVITQVLDLTSSCRGA